MEREPDWCDAGVTYNDNREPEEGDSAYVSPVLSVRQRLPTT